MRSAVFSISLIIEVHPKFNVNIMKSKIKTIKLMNIFVIKQPLLYFYYIIELIQHMDLNLFGFKLDFNKSLKNLINLRISISLELCGKGD